MKVVYEDTAYVPVNQKAIKNILNCFFVVFFSKNAQSLLWGRGLGVGLL